MEDIQIDLYGFLAALEVAFVLLVIALVFFIRSKSLAGRVQLLQRKLKKAQAQDAVEAVSFDQYLRDEVIRNQELIDSAAASDDDAEKKAAELLRMRNQFLELEIEVRSLENNPVKFQDRLAAGMSDRKLSQRQTGRKRKLNPVSNRMWLKNAPLSILMTPNLTG